MSNSYSQADTRLGAPFDACNELAAAKNANLYRAAMRLSPERQRFFLASYASMRIIDDIVDDGFLEQSDDDRNAAREDVMDTIDLWQAQVVAAKANLDNPLPEDGPLDPDVYQALRQTLGHSDLAATPWIDLADALRRDVAEEPMDEWEDFIDYCEGATAAPASIFVYLLSARYDPDIGYTSLLTNTPLYHAHDMAIFCYIVHILRDLPEDIRGPDRLVTIPSEVLIAADITLGEIRNAIGQQKYEDLDHLSQILLEHAWEHFEVGQARSGELLSILDADEADTLSRLFTVYIGLGSVMMENGYAAFLENRDSIMKDLTKDQLPDIPQ
ncbi:squalene/phytoene synthase family protein [Thalassospira sp. MA62]|nr:squalene/phytoene synthase family protein [Thalassospira sp. MA62]